MPVGAVAAGLDDAWRTIGTQALPSSDLCVTEDAFIRVVHELRESGARLLAAEKVHVERRRVKECSSDLHDVERPRTKELDMTTFPFGEHPRDTAAAFDFPAFPCEAVVAVSLAASREADVAVDQPTSFLETLAALRAGEKFCDRGIGSPLEQCVSEPKQAQPLRPSHLGTRIGTGRSAQARPPSVDFAVTLRRLASPKGLGVGVLSSVARNDRGARANPNVFNAKPVALDTRSARTKLMAIGERTLPLPEGRR